MVDKKAVAFPGAFSRANTQGTIKATSGSGTPGTYSSGNEFNSYRQGGSNYPFGGGTGSFSGGKPWDSYSSNGLSSWLRGQGNCTFNSGVNPMDNSYQNSIGEMPDIMNNPGAGMSGNSGSYGGNYGMSGGFFLGQAEKNCQWFDQQAQAFNAKKEAEETRQKQHDWNVLYNNNRQNLISAPAFRADSSVSGSSALGLSAPASQSVGDQVKDLKTRRKEAELAKVAKETEIRARREQEIKDKKAGKTPATPPTPGKTASDKENVGFFNGCKHLAIGAVNMFAGCIGDIDKNKVDPKTGEDKSLWQRWHFNGTKALVTGVVTTAVVAAVAAVELGTLGAATPFVVGALGAAVVAGGAVGVAQAGHGVYQYCNAKTKAEGEDALENTGEGLMGIGTAFIGGETAQASKAVGLIGKIKNGGEAITTLTEAGKAGETVASGAAKASDKVIEGIKAIKATAKTEQAAKIAELQPEIQEAIKGGKFQDVKETLAELKELTKGRGKAEVKMAVDALLKAARDAGTARITELESKIQAAIKIGKVQDVQETLAELKVLAESNLPELKEIRTAANALLKTAQNAQAAVTARITELDTEIITIIQKKGVNGLPEIQQPLAELAELAKSENQEIREAAANILKQYQALKPTTLSRVVTAGSSAYSKYRPAVSQKVGEAKTAVSQAWSASEGDRLGALTSAARRTRHAVLNKKNGHVALTAGASAAYSPSKGVYLYNAHQQAVQEAETQQEVDKANATNEQAIAESTATELAIVTDLAITGWGFTETDIKDKDADAILKEINAKKALLVPQAKACGIDEKDLPDTKAEIIAMINTEGEKILNEATRLNIKIPKTPNLSLLRHEIEQAQLDEVEKQKKAGNPDGAKPTVPGQKPATATSTPAVTPAPVVAPKPPLAAAGETPATGGSDRQLS